MRILQVVGARPNFMKVAPVMRALSTYAVQQELVYTGQHYDSGMSRVFFEDLGLPEPDFNLEVGSASHAIQTADVMVRFEAVLLTHRPDWVIVYGDINSTVAAALVAAKLHIPVAHVEAGLRSFDRTMPEELNRLVTDQLADILFTPSADGDGNLLREGIPVDRIHCVGNVMIDTLVQLLPKAVPPRDIPLSDRYALVTLHRPSNVDNAETLRELVVALGALSRDVQVVFPVHPRTRQRLSDWQIETPAGDRLLLLEPLGYLQFLALQRDAVVVITDSGGIQEETTYLGVPCLTMRENTERPITVTLGTNTLVGQDMPVLLREAARVLNGKGKTGEVPPLWDGHAAERLAGILVR